MTDRIATFSAYQYAVDNLMQRQVDLSQTQQQLTSGKRVSQASDDPAAASQAARANALQAMTTANERAVQASQNAMTLTESALGNASSRLQQARQVVVQAGDASYTASERASLANQVAAIRTELLSTANTSNGQGGYLFSGQGSGSQPFVDQASATGTGLPGGVHYQGTPGQQTIAVDTSLPLSMDGNAVWMQSSTGNGVFQTVNLGQQAAPSSDPTKMSQSAWIDSGAVTDPAAATASSGSTYKLTFSVSGGATTYTMTKDGVAYPAAGQPFAYTSGQQITVDGKSFSISGAPANGDQFELVPAQKNLSVFDALDQVTQALGNPSLSQSQVTQVVQQGLGAIDQVSSSISGARSMAGTMLNRLTGVLTTQKNTVVSAQTAESNATDLDMVKALSNYNNQQTAFSAALQSYASIQKISLFNYING